MVFEYRMSELQDMFQPDLQEEKITYVKESAIKKTAKYLLLLRRLFLFDFDFFFHINLFSLRIVEDIFQKR